MDLEKELGNIKRINIEFSKKIGVGHNLGGLPAPIRMIILYHPETKKSIRMVHIMMENMSASLMINNILVQLSEYVEQKHFEQVKLVLYMNMCGYTFTKHEVTDITTEEDNTHELVRAWVQELIIEGCTKSTIKQYQCELKNFILFTGISIARVSEKNIRDYLIHGKLIKKWKDKTYNSKVRSIRSFFRWAYTEDFIKQDPMKKIKETKEEFVMGSVLTPEQREILRCACRTERELAIVDLLYSSGARISEICQLNRNSIDFANRRMIIYGKGRKEREIYFSAQARVHLMDYLATRTDDNPALFVQSKRPYGRLSDDGVRCVLKQIQARDKRLNGLQISPHTFRRTCGTDMLNRGAAAEMVKEKLGHTKVDTTLQCYARMSTETARDAERRYGVAS